MAASKRGRVHCPTRTLYQLAVNKRVKESLLKLIDKESIILDADFEEAFGVTIEIDVEAWVTLQIELTKLHPGQAFASKGTYTVEERSTPDTDTPAHSLTDIHMFHYE